MFIFTPVHPVGPRERYLAAVADAESKYISALAREEALRLHRLEHAILNRERDIRRRLFSSSLHEHQSGYDYSHFPSSLYNPFASAYEGDIQRHRLIALARREQEEEERRLIAAYHARQQEVERRRLAITRQQEEDSTRAFYLRRQKELGSKRKEQEFREKETVMRLLLGIRTEPVAAAESKKEKKSSAAPSQPQSASVPKEAKLEANKTGSWQHEASTLRAQLESRLGGEYDSEIRDTIQAILASLSRQQPSRTANSPATPKTEGMKGKGKAVSFDIPPTKPTSKDILRSIEEINSIEAHFLALESDFVFPRALNFSPTASPTYSFIGSAIKLAHTAANAPVHNFAHALTLLLSQLDAVESYGIADVRSRRKEVVLRVEGALQDVEKVIDEKERLNRKASQDSLKDVVAQEKKEVAKESLTESSASAALPEAAAAGVESSPTLGDTEDAVESSDTSAIKGYDVVPSPQELTPAPSTTEIATAEVPQHALTASMEAAPDAVSIVEQPATDAVEKSDSTPAQPVDRDGSDSDTSITHAEGSPTSLSFLVSTTDGAEPEEPVDAFLLSRSESASKSTSGRKEDVEFIDEDSDWLDIDTVH